MRTLSPNPSNARAMKSPTTISVNPSVPREPLSLDQANPRRFQPFSTLDDIDEDGLPFGEAHEPGSFESGDMDEHVLPATVESNEAEASFNVEPLHRAGL